MTDRQSPWPGPAERHIDQALRYTYDPNGNLSAGAGRTLTWTSFDKVEGISQTTDKGQVQLAYLYGTDQARVRETYSLNGSLQRTTVYLNPADGSGLLYEEESGVSGTKMKHYLTAGGQTFGVITCNAAFCTQPVNTTTLYWHKDHLGSVSAVSTQDGGVVERMAYEPFGKRRQANGLTDASGTLSTPTDRGYTEHEHMDEVGLINMNGRVFDPALGRFLSPDPLVQDPLDAQSFNRYAYLQNNPLWATDPSGYEGNPAGGTTVTGSSPSSPNAIGGVSVPADATHIRVVYDKFGANISFFTPAPFDMALDGFLNHVVVLPLHNIVSKRGAKEGPSSSGKGGIRPAASAVGAPGSPTLATISNQELAEISGKSADLAGEALGEAAMFLADKVEDFDNSELGHAVQGLPAGGVALKGTSAGLLGLGRLGKLAKGEAAAAKGAANVANGPRLANQLVNESARSPFTATGTLTK